MTEAEGRPARQPWGWGRWTLLIAGVVAALLAALVVGLLRVNRGDLEHAARLIRERNARREIPDADNTLFLFQRVERDFNPMPQGLASLENDKDFPFRIWSPANFPDLSAWVEQNKPLLGVLAERRRRHFRWYDPLRDPAGTVLSDIFPMQALGKLQVLSSLSRDDRLLSVRLSDLENYHRLASSAGEGVAIEYLVSIACQGLALRGMASALLAWPPSAEEARAILARLEALRGETAFDPCESLQEERITLLASLEHLYTAPVSSPWGDLGPVRLITIKPMVEERIEEAFMRMISAARASPHTPAAHGATTWPSGGIVRDLLDGGPLAKFLVSTLEGLHLKYWQKRAQLDALILLVACQGYRAEHGDWPAALADLVPGWLPELPKDPFTASDFLYRREPDGTIRIWSVGKDYADNGGDETADVVVGRPTEPLAPAPSGGTGE